MTTILAHFDGQHFIPDEPVMLEPGQAVRVFVDSKPVAESPPDRPSLFGFAKGTFEIRDDFNDPLDEFAEYR